MAEWRSARHLERHFRDHGRALGTDTLEAYERGSNEVIEIGRSFSYRDRQTGEWRIGYYDWVSGRFTATDEDGIIITTHMRCREGYIRGLPDNDYDG